MMAGIRSTNTKPERIVRSELHRRGFRFRLATKIDGIKPDIVLPKHRAAIFVHGCFWHQHQDCKYAYSDREYSESWQKKFESNKERDKRVFGYLTDAGWRVAIIWECSLRSPVSRSYVIDMVEKWLKHGKPKVFETGVADKSVS